MSDHKAILELLLANSRIPKGAYLEMIAIAARSMNQATVDKPKAKRQTKAKAQPKRHKGPYRWKGKDYNSTPELAEACGVKVHTIQYRLRNGLTVAQACKPTKKLPES